MTRNEAIELALRIGHNDARCTICLLEELGLIKFDEELSPSMIIRKRLGDFFPDGMKTADGIINDLYKAGYKIVK